MITYKVKNKCIEICYETGFELTVIKYCLEVLDLFNQARNKEER